VASRPPGCACWPSPPRHIAAARFDGGSQRPVEDVIGPGTACRRWPLHAPQPHGRDTHDHPHLLVPTNRGAGTHGLAMTSGLVVYNIAGHYTAGRTIRMSDALVEDQFHGTRESRCTTSTAAERLLPRDVPA